MKTVLITFLWMISCLSLCAQEKQELEDSVSVVCRYDAAREEIVVNLENRSGRVLYVPQYAVFTETDAGSVIQIHSRDEANLFFYGLCRFVEGVYQPIEKMHIIRPQEKITFQTKISFKKGDVLSVRVHIVCVYARGKAYTCDRMLDIHL